MDRLKEFQERFKAMSDDELTQVFNEQKKHNGWTSTRALFMTTLQLELEKRKLPVT